jgi:DNA ligase-1
MGAEGLMVRDPVSKYECKRSKNILKCKTFFDHEAEVIGHENGKGRLEHMTGKLIVKVHGDLDLKHRGFIRNGTTFKVGSGMTDSQRQNPPKIGSFITFRFHDLTSTGKPRFPTFVCVRDYE